MSDTYGQRGLLAGVLRNGLLEDRPAQNLPTAGLLADILRRPAPRGLLTNPDPVSEAMANLPAEPNRYGAALTNRTPDAVDGVRPMFGLPQEGPLVSPAQEARTRALAEILTGTSSGVLPHLGMRYVRRSLSADSPFNPGSPGMAMFAHDRGNPTVALESLRSYGPAAWRGNDAGSVDVTDIQRPIVRALRDAGLHETHNTTAAALARDANPQNIVESAGLWDNPELVREVWDQVLEPRGVTAVRTQDGLIIFDPSHATAVRAP